MDRDCWPLVVLAVFALAYWVGSWWEPLGGHWDAARRQRWVGAAKGPAGFLWEPVPL